MAKKYPRRLEEKAMKGRAQARIRRDKTVRGSSRSFVPMGTENPYRAEAATVLTMTP